MKANVFNHQVNKEVFNSLNLIEKRPIIISKMREALDFYELSNWKGVVDYSTSKRAGLCSYIYKTVSISDWLIKLNDFDVIWDTVTHEIAHALTPGCHHNWKWKAMHISMGGDGQRCYDSSNTVNPVMAANSHEKDWAIYAPASIKHLLGKQVALYNKVFEITGWDTRSKKYSVKMKCIHTEKAWKAPVSDFTTRVEFVEPVVKQVVVSNPGGYSLYDTAVSMIGQHTVHGNRVLTISEVTTTKVYVVTQRSARYQMSFEQFKNVFKVK